MAAHELQMEETEGICLWAGRVPATEQGLDTGRQNETQLCNLLQANGQNWTERAFKAGSRDLLKQQIFRNSFKISKYDLLFKAVTEK